MYFFSDANNFKKSWKSENNECIGKIWINMLKYFAYDFDYKNFIIHIGCTAPLLKNTAKEFIIIEGK